MKKLAFLALAFAACVDELPPESAREPARVATAEGTTGTRATEVEIFNDYGVMIDIATVEIAGVEERPRDFNDTLDLGRPRAIEEDATFTELCKLADDQPIDSACSLICDLPAFAARMVRDTEFCRSIECPTEGGGVATVVVCPE
ncbi:MAG: hypothetical protein AB7P03_05970 [Kofleriaceae bacterium]